MEDTPMLFIPGPTYVPEEIAQAQARPMIGHRSREFTALFERLLPRLQAIFRTRGRVFFVAASGTGLWEAAIRNLVRRKALCLINGAFGERWYQVVLANGKEAIPISIEWGRGVRPEQVIEALEAHRDVEAITVVHNETSTGVMNPLQEIAAAVRHNFPEVLILVDAVSSLGGAPLETDAWGLDFVLTSSQKCLALPPGLAFCAVSERALEKAKEVPHRGYYFDLLTLARYAERGETPATPPISLLYAADAQFERILQEGMEARWERHRRMAERVQTWAAERFGLFAEENYRSWTLTCVANTRGIDVGALNEFLRTRGKIISSGYGPLKGKTFRIAHMGEIQPHHIEALLADIEAWLALRG
ncbi:pyridoxal-phosphate-dependent aminotransferase family protein [Thermoflexus sp.]|uniref:pyridoxal-phosphate-dependent aminotransferase family protein n=1 Tax=Thermoflexus sp. TaxID=1969742 RepID=UPI0035E44197